MEQVSRRLLAQQYTGTNAAEVLAMCQTITQYTGNVWSIDSDDGQTLRMRETSGVNPTLWYDWPIMKNQVVIVAPDTGIIARMTQTAYEARYTPLAKIIADGAAPVLARCDAAVAAVKYGGFGAITLPTLLVGQTSTPQVVEIRPTQPGVEYVAEAWALSGGTILSALQIVSITRGVESDGKSKSVTVVVKNNGLITLSGILLVHVTPKLTETAAAK